MKEILKNLKSGIVVGIGFLFTILVGGTIYAVVNNIWTNPNTLEATSGSPLTSEAWNKILSNQNALSGALSSLNSSLTNLNTNLTNLTTKVNTLSGVVSSISIITNSSNPPNVAGQVIYNGKYWKSFGTTTMTRTNAFGSTSSATNTNGCPSLGIGWRLPSMGELRYVYKDKTNLNTLGLNLQNGGYWSDVGLGDADGRNEAVNMQTGARTYYAKTQTIYTLCIHD